jgi:predicted nicotinamide N-methyase
LTAKAADIDPYARLPPQRLNAAANGVAVEAIHGDLTRASRRKSI